MGLLTDKINLEKRNYEHALNRESVPLTADVCISGVTEKRKHFGRGKEGKCLFSWLDLFTIGGHIEFIRFKEYYGMSRGSRSGIYARFSGKKRTSREKAIIVTSKSSSTIFFPIIIFL